MDRYKYVWCLCSVDFHLFRDGLECIPLNNQGFTRPHIHLIPLICPAKCFTRTLTLFLPSSTLIYHFSLSARDSKSGMKTVGIYHIVANSAEEPSINNVLELISFAFIIRPGNESQQGRL